MSATPRPWLLDRATVYALGPDGTNRMSAFVDYYTRQGGTAEEACDNAELIVRAVNAHDELLEACKAALNHIRMIERDIKIGYRAEIEAQLEDAISQAEATVVAGGTQ
jgi:hypothetical protein